MEAIKSLQVASAGLRLGGTKSDADHVATENRLEMVRCDVGEVALHASRYKSGLLEAAEAAGDEGQGVADRRTEMCDLGIEAVF